MEKRKGKGVVIPGAGGNRESTVKRVKTTSLTAGLPVHAGNDSKKAFTLIELLVVVLIIGILSAIALPQYQKAVVKSRLATIIPVMQGIKTGFESYYLANGAYPSAGAFDISKLDITSSCPALKNDPSVAKCDNYFLIDALGGNNTTQYVRAYYCPDYQENIFACAGNYEFVYTLWLDKASNYPGKRECTGRTRFGTRICKSIQ